MEVQFTCPEKPELLATVSGYYGSFSALLSVSGQIKRWWGTLPNTVYELIAGGAMASIVVPLLSRAALTEPDGGVGYAQRLLSLLAYALATVTLLATLAADMHDLQRAADALAEELRRVRMLPFAEREQLVDAIFAEAVGSERAFCEELYLAPEQVGQLLHIGQCGIGERLRRCAR